MHSVGRYGHRLGGINTLVEQNIIFSLCRIIHIPSTPGTSVLEHLYKMTRTEGYDSDFSQSSSAALMRARSVPTPPWMRCPTQADQIEAEELQRKEQAEQSWLTQIIEIPVGLPLAGIHKVIHMQYMPSQTFSEVKNQNKTTFLEVQAIKDWEKTQTYTVYRKMSHANACYLPIPLKEIPSHESTVVICFHMVYFPPVRQGDHWYPDLSKSGIHSNGLNPEWDQNTGATRYKGQCLVKGCSCGNMLFTSEYERNRHMDGCFDGRHNCTGCGTIFQYHDDGVRHVEARCPVDSLARLETFDPVPHWRKRDSEHSKRILKPHFEDHLYKELGYAKGM
ncbi:hypothetical protein BDY19DRAFT_389170 [Irpex rosettiformis]|uniref:Uncharacterized protein n=1 Tax=Irpex rosettiformis TaxID=378272 RepID=A0ACB8TUJ3_9APHY|nr:hypothetical protein BDY19DRAFT_389170 [Irpex rosettiformis]